MARYELNESLNGVEIYFDGIPSVAVREEIKAAGFHEWLPADITLIDKIRKNLAEEEMK